MRISKGFWVIGAFIAAAPVLLALSGCNKKQPGTQNEILIGEYGSLTGSTATFGQSTHKGIQMAVEQMNLGEDVLPGRKIRVVTEDDQGKPEEAQTAVTKLI